MKKIWILILSLWSLLFVWMFTQAKDYEYTNLNIFSRIDEDGSVYVKEWFVVKFFTEKHWIMRDIPLNYSVEWVKFHIDIKNIWVEWSPFTKSTQNWILTIKIWDANKTVKGLQSYPISYDTYGLIRNFSWMWYAELYWNLVGYDFDTNISNVRAEILLPKTYTWFTADDFLITTDWKSKTIDWFEWSVDWSEWDRIIITYNENLPAYHGITLAIKFPNNYFKFDDNEQAKLLWHIWNTNKKNGYSVGSNEANQPITNSLALLIAIGVLVAIFSCLFLCWKLLRLLGKLVSKICIYIIERKYKLWGSLHWKFAKKYPVITQYEPPIWLNSAEVWLLLHRRSDCVSLASLIYKWIAEWLISVDIQNNKSKLYIIKRIKDKPGSFQDYESSFWNAIFGGKNKREISKDTSLNTNRSLSALQENGYKNWRFKKDKNEKKHYNIKFAYLFIFILMIITVKLKWEFLLTIEFMLLGILFFYPLLLFLMNIKIPKYKELVLTEEWANLVSKILWYRNFLKSCDENKLKLSLEKDPLYFDKILPYAIVFGIETELIKKMTPIMEELWLTPYINYSDLDYFNHSLSDLTIYSTPNEPLISPETLSKFYESSGWWYSSGWFSSWSSFSWWWSSFSSWWGWGWWGWRSW